MQEMDDREAKQSCHCCLSYENKQLSPFTTGLLRILLVGISGLFVSFAERGCLYDSDDLLDNCVVTAILAILGFSPIICSFLTCMVASLGMSAFIVSMMRAVSPEWWFSMQDICRQILFTLLLYALVVPVAIGVGSAKFWLFSGSWAAVKKNLRETPLFALSVSAILLSGYWVLLLMPYASISANIFIAYQKFHYTLCSYW